MLSILLVTAMSTAVMAGAYTAYVHTHRSQQAAEAATSVTDLGQRVRTSYAGNANFQSLNTEGALHDGVYPKGLIGANGQPKNVWGGAIELAGTSNGFAVTYENVDPNVCARFVMAAAGGWSDVTVDGHSVMAGRRASAQSATMLCSQVAATGATVQFMGTRPAGAVHSDLVPCVVPAPQTQQVACPAGQLSRVAPYSPNGITQQRDGACLSAYGASTWTPWRTIGNTCVPACVAPPPGTDPSGVNTASCPAGQVTIASGASSFTQSGTRTITYTCPLPVGGYTTTYGPWSWSPPVSSTCAPACVAPATTSTGQTQAAGCPAGQVTSSGATSFTQSRTATTTYNCPAPTGAFASATSYTTWSPASMSVCAPKCTAPATTTTSQSQSAACPSGQTTSSGGTSFTQTRSVTTTYSCPAPQGSYTSSTSYGAWSPSAGSVCSVSTSPVSSGGFGVWIYNDQAGQDPQCATSVTYSQNEQYINNLDVSCSTSTLGDSAGGDWCDGSSSPVVDGVREALCVYSVGYTGSGSLTAGGTTYVTDSASLGSAYCTTGKYPAFSFDRSISINGNTYQVRGSCPNGAPRTCSVSYASPGATITYANSGIQVSWAGAQKVYSQSTTSSTVDFYASSGPNSSTCSNVTVNTSWSHMEY